MTTDALLRDAAEFLRDRCGCHRAHRRDNCPGCQLLARLDRALSKPRPAPFPHIERWAAGGELAEPSDAEEAVGRARIRAWVLERLGSGLGDEQRQMLEWALREPEAAHDHGFDAWWEERCPLSFTEPHDAALAAWEARGADLALMVRDRDHWKARHEHDVARLESRVEDLHGKLMASEDAKGTLRARLAEVQTERVRALAQAAEALDCIAEAFLDYCEANPDPDHLPEAWADTAQALLGEERANALYEKATRKASS